MNLIFYIILVIALTLLAVKTISGQIGVLQQKRADLSEAGKLIYASKKPEFEAFYKLYFEDKKEFLSRYEDVLDDHDFEIEKLKPLEILYLFGDVHEKLAFTDWRGEENEKEIEEFLEQKLSVKPNWKNVDILRQQTGEEQKRNGYFIIDLLKTMDKDLMTIDKKLIFFDLSWDAYVYTVVDTSTYQTLATNFHDYFHGSERLKK